ncbi:MAG TPA: phosphatidylinositol mannoside acyltransferase [Acidimicrobiia bacterium]|nr:phosphatidylinositol mannoside acyltransferase [Acidimicrobiia bacterium]
MALAAVAEPVLAAAYPSLTGPVPNPIRVPSPIKARAAYLAYRTGAELARLVPEPVAQPAARVLGQTLSLAMPDRRRQVERNLRRATAGELDGLALRKAVAETFGSYGRYWLELFRLPDEAKGELELDIVGFEHVTQGVEHGKGVVLALPHVGGWDFAGAWLAAQGLRPTVVAEPVEPPELFEWFAGVREALGMTVVQLGPDAGRAVLHALRRNEVVCLLCDRDLVGDGIQVDFFGERTTLPAGPATLALRTGAPLLPTAVYFEPGGGHHAVVMSPVPAQREGRLRDDVGRVTQDLAYRFEELIRAAPQQWHLLQPNWPSDRTTNGSVEAKAGS